VVVGSNYKEIQMKKIVLAAMMVSFTLPAMAESMSDIIDAKLKDADKNKPVAQMMDQNATKKKDAPPPRLVGVRGVDENVTATFESDDGAFEASTKMPELGNGWELVSIGGARAQIRRGTNKPITIFLTDRVGNASTSQDYVPPAPPVAQYAQ